MNHLRADAEAFATAFLASYAPREGVMVGVAPSYPQLSMLAGRFTGRGVDVLAQNAYYEPKGAFARPDPSRNAPERPESARFVD